MKQYKCLWTIISILYLWSSFSWSMQGLELKHHTEINHEQFAALQYFLEKCPSEILHSILYNQQPLSYEEFIQMHPGVVQENNPKEIYQNKIKIWHEEQSKLSKPTENFDTNLCSKLDECSTNYCPYYRKSDPSLRDTIIRAISTELAHPALLTSILSDLNNTLVITSFASGGLFQDLLIMLSLSKIKHVKNLNIELNLIDKSYDRYINNSQLSNETKMTQFNNLMQYLFPNIKIFIYSDVKNYIEDVENKIRMPSHILWAIDYGVETFEIISCQLDLRILATLGTNSKHLEFHFPYHYQSSCQIFYEKNFSCNDKKVLKNNLMQIIDLASNAQGYEIFNPASEVSKLIVEINKPLIEIEKSVKIKSKMFFKQKNKKNYYFNHKALGIGAAIACSIAVVSYFIF